MNNSRQWVAPECLGRQGTSSSWVSRDGVRVELIPREICENQEVQPTHLPSPSLSHMKGRGQRCCLLLSVWYWMYNWLTDSVSFLPSHLERMYSYVGNATWEVAVWLEKMLKYIHIDVSLTENFILIHRRKNNTKHKAIIWYSFLLHHLNTFPDYSHHSCGALHTNECFSWVRHNLQTASETWTNTQTLSLTQQQELGDILKVCPCPAHVDSDWMTNRVQWLGRAGDWDKRAVETHASSQQWEHWGRRMDYIFLK